MKQPKKLTREQKCCLSAHYLNWKDWMLVEETEFYYRMIKIENVEVMGWEHVIRGMRNPMNSWDKSDSGICKGGDDGIGCKNCAGYDCGHTYDHSFQLGKTDHELMMKLAAGGPVHAKYRRMIVVYLDITAPLYWWKEFDTYKVGTVANSCSTMHKIAEKEFTLEDFSCEHLIKDEENPIYSALNDERLDGGGLLGLTVNVLNHWRRKYLEIAEQLANDMTHDEMVRLQAMKKKYWWPMIQLLPSSYNQRRTVMLNYEVLAGIYPMRKNHKLDEWREFCQWIEQLPYSEIIIGGDVK